jgi:hypothetical protein
MSAIAITYKGTQIDVKTIGKRLPQLHEHAKNWKRLSSYKNTRDVANANTAHWMRDPYTTINSGGVLHQISPRVGHGARPSFGGCRYRAILKPKNFPDRVAPGRFLNRFEMSSAPSRGASG